MLDHVQAKSYILLNKEYKKKGKTKLVTKFFRCWRINFM